jgi:uncharacterized membrane protein
MSAGVDAREGAMPTVVENVEAIKAWDQALLEKRSHAQRFSDNITRVAASGMSLMAHALWFISWIAINTGVLPVIARFDEFPFPVLTMMVSLEAIFLALFVLASQNRLARQSELRANLNLQIDLLAEREMTTVLQLLKDISAHLNVKTSVAPAHLNELIEETDVQELASQVDEDEPAQP